MITPAGAVTTNVWDDEGLRSSVILPSGVVSTTIYNGDRRLDLLVSGRSGAAAIVASSGEAGGTTLAAWEMI